MTRKEIELALKQLDDLGAYSVRLFLDNQTTVLAHQWSLESPEEREGDEDEEKSGGEEHGLLRVVARGRQALIAISRIVLIEVVPPPQ